MNYLILFALLLLVVGYYYRTNDLSTFLTSNGNENSNFMAMSIAASWIWAPALFISAQQAYLNGIVGLFWFTVPNIATLIIFGLIACRVREQYIDKITISNVIKEKLGNRIQNLYIFELLTLATLSIAVQLLAGGFILSKLTGMPIATISIIILSVITGYSMFSGIKSSIRTDVIQIVLIFGILVVVLFCLFSTPLITMSTVGTGIYGINNIAPFSAKSFDLFISFGLPVTFGLLAGPWGDQMFWQRAYTLKPKNVKRTFIKAAIIFGFVPILMSFLGFVAAGLGFVPKTVQFVNYELVSSFLGPVLTSLFSILLLAGLMSTVDSAQCAISSIFAVDVADKFKVTRKKTLAKTALVILSFLGYCISLIPGMQIMYLWLIFGTLRASVFLPTIMAVFNKYNEKIFFYGILFSMIIGTPAFAVLMLMKYKFAAFLVSLAVTLITPICYFIYNIGHRCR